MTKFKAAKDKRTQRGKGSKDENSKNSEDTNKRYKDKNKCRKAWRVHRNGRFWINKDAEKNFLHGYDLWGLDHTKSYPPPKSCTVHCVLRLGQLVSSAIPDIGPYLDGSTMH